MPIVPVCMLDSIFAKARKQERKSELNVHTSVRMLNPGPHGWRNRGQRIGRVEVGCVPSLVAQPPPAEGIRQGPPAHTLSQGPQAIGKGKGKSRRGQKGGQERSKP
eukprot:365394-Chlamydomonas_euryale.AAC.7